MVAVAAFAMLLPAALVACGGDDDDDSGTTPGTTASGDNGSGGQSNPDSPTTTGGSGGAPQSGGAGALTLGDETFEFERARCFLQEQDAAAGGGKILFTAQAFGSIADGTEFVLDISRYDEDSQFTGDDIIIDVGDPRSDDVYSWSARAPLGTIQRDGSTLRASGLTFEHGDDGTKKDGAFEVNC